MAKYPLPERGGMEAHKIREEFNGQVSAPAHVVRMNQIITDVPFGDGGPSGLMDTSEGGSGS